jgi:hypothetical protein
VVGCLLLAPGTTQTIYACINGSGIQASTDGGTTWSAVNSGLPTLDVSGLARDGTTGTLYASTASGVYSKLGSQPWTGLDVGCMGTAGVPAIIVDGSSRWLAVASHGGVYRHPL